MKQYKIRVNDNEFDIQVHSLDDNGVATVTVNGTDHTVYVEREKKSVAPTSIKAPSGISRSKHSAAVESQSVSPEVNIAGTPVASPLPGVIISVNVAVGDKVVMGQSVATLEAMKMENSIEADRSGIVTAIHVQKGDSVLQGAKIVTIG